MLSTSPAAAQSEVVVTLAGEAYDGPPQFQVLAGTEVIGSGVLKHPIETKTEGRLFASARPSAFLEVFSFSVADDDILPDRKISVLMTNDKFAEGDAGYDRNLFIDSIRVNGHELTSAELVLFEKGVPHSLDYQAGMLPIYEQGQQAVASPPPTGWPLAAPAGAAQLVSSPYPVPRPAWLPARAQQ
jgi:hypothetical protein